MHDDEHLKALTNRFQHTEREHEASRSCSRDINRTRPLRLRGKITVIH